MKNSMTIFSLSVSLMISTAAMSSGAQTKVIYGDDDRIDVADSNNSLYIKLAKSTAAMISHSKLKEYNNEEMEVLGQAFGVGKCSAEKFSKQPAAANCSGFLVAENILVTAGHCVRNQSSCDSYAWVFDYKVDHVDQAKVIVDKTDVYKCKSIISQTLDSTTQNDYAVIELDKNVTDRDPLAFREQGKPLVGDELVVIGHPAGLPTKIADGANVRSLNDIFLVANLDTYGGNSGSAVFNSTTGMIEGILVRGERDFRYNSELGCTESNVVSDNEGRGEDVTLITAVKGLPASVSLPTEEEEEDTAEEETEEDEVDEPSRPSAFAAFLRYLRRIFG